MLKVGIELLPISSLFTVEKSVFLNTADYIQLIYVIAV